MYLLYSTLLTIGIIILLPRFAWDALRHGKYVTGLSERLGRIPFLKITKHPVIWLHSVSVGETQASRTIVHALRKRFPGHTLVVSTTTLTGQRVAREVFTDEAERVFYFPFDWSWTVRRSLKAIQPDLVLLMETELWPNFLRECNRREIPVSIVNGRLSERSFRRFRFVPRFSSKMVGHLDLALMQTESDAERMQGLGLPAERVKVTGNIKFDADTSPSDLTLCAELRQRYQFEDGRPLLVAASTHDPEERIVIDAFKQLRESHDSRAARLLIAPRHPERFAAVASLLSDSGLSWSRRSELPKASDALCDVILLDSIGELRATYPLAEVVFVGGSMTPIGGHNILEPIAAGRCVITGAHTSNFAEIMRTFVDADAVVQLPPISELEASGVLASAFKTLLENSEMRSALVARTQSIVEQSRGATMLTVDLVAGLLADQRV